MARGIHDKLVRRHPHVFGEVVADDAGTVVRNWDQIKREERHRKAGSGRAGPFDGVPRALPALAYAAKVQRRAPTAALPGSLEAARAEVSRRLAGPVPASGEAMPPPDDLGALLFAVVDLARELGVDAEEALRLQTERFRAAVEDRFAEVADPLGDVR